MAEVITVKVEPFYFDENAEEQKSDPDPQDFKNQNDSEDNTEQNIQDYKIDFVNVKSEIDTSIVKEEPPDFILPHDDVQEEEPMLSGGVTEEDLNRNAVEEANNICETCQRTFTRKSHLRMHKILHSQERLECHLCYLRFEHFRDYNSHITSHDLNYCCYICGKSFKSFTNLRNHKKLHTDALVFKCDHCSKDFTHKANLSRHQKLGICKNKDALTCPVCKKVFEKAFFLKSHLKKHTTEKPFQCDLCSMFFKHKSTLARHIHLHSGVRPYACTYCPKTFSHRGLLEPHLRKHTGEKPFPCPRCPKKFSHKHNMLRHLERHAKEKNLQCKLCMKVFPRESRLIYHMRSHTNSKPFRCDVCGKKFTHKSNVLRHYSRKHPNEKYETKFTDATVAKQVWQKVMQKLSRDVDELNANAVPNGKHKCETCDRGFDTAQFLSEHKLIHHKQKLQCYICYERLPSVEKYESHMKEHEVEGKFRCTQCAFGCKRKSALMKHQEIHFRSFTCKNCDKNFVGQRNLTRHIESKRCHKPLIRCEVCDKEFDKTHLFKSHQRRHTTEKPFECNICGMALKYKSALVQHVLRHTSTKSFKCGECDKTFDNASARKRHLSCHSGEKPFQCDICKKGFSFKHNMQTHMKRHSKKKIVQCMVCDKVFPRESRLIYHMRSHTNSRPFGCDLCVKKFFNKQNLIKHYKDKHPNASYTITTSDATVAKLVWEKIQRKLKEGGKFE